MAEESTAEARVGGPDEDQEARPDPISEPEIEQALVQEAKRRPSRSPSMFHGVDPDRVFNPSEMPKRRGLLIRWISHLLFRRVSFDERHQQTIRDADREGDLVLAMNHHSVLDYLYFTYAFTRLGLPLVYFANSVSMTLFRPLYSMVAHFFRRIFKRYDTRLSETEKLALGLERGRPALIFLKRQAFWPWSGNENDQNAYLKRLLRTQRERIAACREGEEPRSIFVIPQLMIWSQDPDRYGTRLGDMVFGKHDAPSRFRKAINFFVNRRRAFVQLGKPIDLNEFLAEQEPGLGLETLARKLGFRIHQSLTLEERVIKGPILKSAKRLREEILRTREVQEEIARLAEAAGKRPDQIEKIMSRYLKEMAADFSISYIEVMCILLTLVFDRIYKEIVPDLDGLEKVREAARKAPLILLPCHRSHVDYLVISYIFYANGMIAPHIAAGKNLNFWPLGHIFRRSGAFFIRRSFKGNEPYRISFREYLRKLIKEGYWIEFFIEGGRSRTGKMLPPKYGMMSRVIEAVQNGAAPDVYFVPVYLGYEQIIEERAYTAELAGAEKKKESITALIKTTKVLWSRYGRLYVNFAEPISCRELIEREQVMELPNTDPKFQTFLRKASYKVLEGINGVAMLTPSSVAAMALLMHPKRGVSRSILLARVGFILDVAGRKRQPLSKTLSNALKIRRQEVALAISELEASGDRDIAFALGEKNPVAIARGRAVEEVIDEALTRFVNQKHVEKHTYDEETVFTPVPTKRINLDFYKNNIVHLFVVEALIAAAVRGEAAADGRAELAEVREAASFLGWIFKREFVYDPELGFDEQFDQTLLELSRSGVLELHRPEGAEAEPARPEDAPEGADVIELHPATSLEDYEAVTITERSAQLMELLHQVLEPWLEAYWLLALTLHAELVERQGDKDVVKAAQKRARRAYQEGEISCLEASNSVTFKNAIAALEELGLVEHTKKGRERLLALAPATAEDPGRLPGIAKRLRRYFSH